MMAVEIEYILQRPNCGEGAGMPKSSHFNEKMHRVCKKTG